MLKVIRDIVQSIYQRDLSHHPFIHAETNASQHGFFKSATRVGAGTTIIVQPKASADSIRLTDIFFTTDKVAASTATLNFTDGTDTITIIAAKLNDAPVSIGMSLAGNWHGWGGARIELVTVNAVTVTAAIGYMRVAKEHTIQSFSEWDALR